MGFKGRNGEDLAVYTATDICERLQKANLIGAATWQDWQMEISLVVVRAIREAVAEKDAEIERLRAALTEIAAFDDAYANQRLANLGSYSAFDEPASVEIARKAMKGET